jgi:hypothetical protein
MTYDFYADENDIARILDYIFTETDLILYELASNYGQEIKSFRETSEVLKNYHFCNSNQSSETFQLWTPKFEGDLVIRKVELNPKFCHGHTFRYSTEGWGLIQLYFGVRKKEKLPFSHIGHQSEKRALLWQDINNNNLGKVDKWNWKEVETTAKKIKYQIHNKMSIRKLNRYGVLQGADKYVEKSIST